MARKGVVLSWSKGKAVVLQTDGSFVSVTTKKVPVGSEISMGRNITVWRFAAAAALLLVFCGGLVFDNYAMAHVTIELESNMELGVNWRNTIVSANGLDEGGAELLQNLSIQGQTLTVAMEKIVGEAKATASSIKDDESKLIAMISVTGAAKTAHVQSVAQAALEDALKLHGSATSQVLGIVLPAVLNKEAKEAGVSPGQYALAIKATEQGQDVTTEQIKSKGLQKALENAGVNVAKIMEAAQDEKNYGQVQKVVRDKVRGGPPSGTPGKGPK